MDLLCRVYVLCILALIAMRVNGSPKNPGVFADLPPALTRCPTILHRNYHSAQFLRFAKEHSMPKTQQDFLEEARREIPEVSV